MADFTALKTAIQTYIKQNGNEEITGEILQEILLSVVTTLGDGAINDLITALGNEVTARQQADGTLQQNITNEATARGNADTALSNRLGSTITAENTAAEQIGAEAEAREAADTALQDLIDGITDNIENGYVYAGIATPSSTPTTGKVFYLALTAGTYTNFGNIAVPQGINILKYNGSAWSLDSFLGLDDAPTQGSSNLVKSGGVLDSIIKDGSAFDLSAYNNGTTYADLNAALTALNALPAAFKKGGMSMKYVHTYDNKYVQARCMAQNFTTDVTQWQGIDDEPTAGSNNTVKSGGTYGAVSKLGQEILGVNYLTELNGYLDGSQKIISYGISKFIALNVEANDVVVIKPSKQTSYMLAASFTGYNGLPYIPDLITGGENKVINENTTETITVPSGCNYILINTARYNYTVPFVTFTKNGIDLLKGLETIVHDTTEKLDTVSETADDLVIFENSVMPLAGCKEVNGHLDGSNKYVLNYGKHIPYKVFKGDSITITANDSINAVVWLLKTYTPNIVNNSSPDFIDEDNFKYVIPSGNTVSFTIPSDCHYINIESQANNVSWLPKIFKYNGISLIDGFLKETGLRIGKVNSNIELVLGYHQVSNAGKLTISAGSFYKNYTVCPYILQVYAGSKIGLNSYDDALFTFAYSVDNGNTWTANVWFDKDFIFDRDCLISPLCRRPSSGDTADTSKQITSGLSITSESISERVSNVENKVKDILSLKTCEVKINKTVNSLMWGQGSAIVNNKLIGFNAGASDHSTNGSMVVYNINTLEFEKSFSHNLGHVNGADYNEDTDSLVTAERVSVSGNTHTAELILVHNFASKLNTDNPISYSGEDTLVIQISNLNGDFPAMACFGENSNIVYLATIQDADHFNDYSGRWIYKLFLGKGSSNMTELFPNASFGTFVSGKGENEYNGTVAIIATYGFESLCEIQGGKYYNGKLYIPTDYHRFNTTETTNTLQSYITRVTLLENGIAEVDKLYHINTDNNSMQKQASESEGLSIRNGVVYHQISIHNPNNPRMVVYNI